ncbi:UNVERIFIED_CONTAM: hypothetical protein Sradi_0724900 [Sesamum radiatum]|uniref:Uncharacterized protein n=1 Tax=Sesamum radiatum TaxID=300843 RepID=A0AAW2VMJ1_SESRA
MKSNQREMTPDFAGAGAPIVGYSTEKDEEKSGEPAAAKGSSIETEIDNNS